MRSAQWQAILSPSDHRELREGPEGLGVDISIPRAFREEFVVLYTTGPGLVSRTLAEYPDAMEEVKVLFPKNVCDTGYWDRFGEYGVHLRQGGWRKPKSFLRRRLIAAWMCGRRRRC